MGLVAMFMNIRTGIVIKEPHFSGPYIQPEWIPHMEGYTN